MMVQRLRIQSNPLLGNKVLENLGRLFTVTKKVSKTAGQLDIVADTITVATIGELLEFDGAIQDGIVPIPLALKPTSVFEFNQLILALAWLVEKTIALNASFGQANTSTCFTSLMPGKTVTKTFLNGTEQVSLTITIV
jgi:hypothetical protein